MTAQKGANSFSPFQILHLQVSQNWSKPLGVKQFSETALIQEWITIPCAGLATGIRCTGRESSWLVYLGQTGGGLFESSNQRCRR
jgi:hypothetical protein